MALATEPAKHGAHSLRLSVMTRTPEDPTPPGSRNYGYVQVTRAFDHEDWTGFNRLSVWVWPDLPGWYTINLRMTLLNDGAEKSPDPVDHNGENAILIPRNHAWNHVVWEIPGIPRDKVVGVAFSVRRQGNEPEASNHIAFYLDHLTLERVQEDHYEGWDVAPGQIAYSQSGYRTDSTKTAIASSSGARTFSLVRTETGEAVLTKPVEKRHTSLGDFEVMDFTEVKTPGSYWIRAGPLSTPPFPIGDDIWRPSLWKALNFFYGERCGTAIPGIHRECHRDWQCEHNGLKLLVNGGWHDAGDLSQGTVNTAEAAYTMFTAAERFDSDPATRALAARFREEGTWGLDWLLKTSFGDGFRPDFSVMGLWTDGILGNNDDITSHAANNPYNNFLAAAAEAVGSRVLAHDDPDRAEHSRKVAEADWRFAVAALEQTPAQGKEVVMASSGVLASVELWKLTGDTRYRDKAFAFAADIVNSQQKSLMPWKPPLTGFFYTNPEKKEVLRFFHRGHEQAPVVALGPAVRGVSRRRALDGLVFHGGAALRVPESAGELLGALSPAASVHLSRNGRGPRSGESARVFPPPGAKWHGARRRLLPAALPRVVRLSRQLRRDAFANARPGHSGAVARRCGGGATGGGAIAVGGGTQSVWAEHDVWRGPSLLFALQRHVRPDRRRAARGRRNAR